MAINRTLALTAILLIVAIAAEDHASPFHRKRFTCPDESTISDCSCQEFGTVFDIYCPQTNPTLEVKFDETKPGVKLKCHGQQDFDSLPNLAIGNISLLIVNGCALNETRPILDTIGFLGVTNARALLYDDYYDLQESQYSATQFEGLENLENLTITRGVGIRPDTFEGLSNLRRLTIQNNKLELERGVFDGLVSLEVLRLEYNKIDRLAEGLFKNQGKLEGLFLARNNIKNITKEVFNGLNNLHQLDLGNNNLASLDPDVFALLPDLAYLNLAFNSFDKFPEAMFRENQKLQIFRLRSNKVVLESLPKDFLANLPQLKNVSMDNCKISHLPESILHHSPQIVELNLAHNRLRTLPETLLRDQHLLRDLNLAHNLLETIPDELLDNMRELTTLRLSNNRLQSLSGEVFRDLTNLKQLHLENNILQTIDRSTFKATTLLADLYLQNNQLSFHANSYVQDELNFGDSDNTPFQYLSKLRTLKLQNNSISVIFTDWYIQNRELHELDLSNNRISQLQYADLQFQSSISVNLSNNNISLIFFPIDKLEVSIHHKINVDLSNNPLDCNCNALDFVKYVQNESTKAIQFTTDRLRCAEPENLRDMTIEEVKPEDLKCKLIEDCPAQCSCDLRLVDYTIVVNCSGRGLSRIPELPSPGSIEDFNFIELHVEDNLLTALPTSALLGYDQVTQLYVRNNSIQQLLPENLPINLHLLDLTHNHLQTIDESTVAFLNRTSRLSSIQLSNNLWRCDCKTSSLLNFIQRNPNRITDIPEVRCNGTGPSFDSITVNDLCNEDLTQVIAICMALAFTGLMVGLLSAMFYRYQTEVKVWLFTHNLFLWLITEEELDRDKRYDAFISYSHLDEDFITEQLVPTLEKEPMNFKTCWHVRDFMPGEMIITQIIKSIEDSRRTVIVLSKNFLQSHWAKEEFRQAHVQSMEDHRVRVIVVIYDDIGDVEKLDGELKAYLKTNTYVKWGDPLFWDKLRYAMPHPLRIRGMGRVDKEILLDHVNVTVPKTA